MSEVKVSVEPDLKSRSIRSYVLRIGRITPSQKAALSTLESEFSIDIESVKFADLYDGRKPLVLEIGFGMGESLVTMAKSEPNAEFIGVEVHLPGVGQCLAQCKSEGLTNLRIVNRDVNDVIDNWLVDRSLDKVQIFFPDPWPKARHQKRRLVQTDFISRLVPKLKQGGVLCLATDWENYAEQMLEVVEAHPELENIFGSRQFASDKTHRVETKFERRGVKLAHQIYDLVYLRK